MTCLAGLQTSSSSWLKLFFLGIMSMLIVGCKPATRSFDNDLCYVIWDGKTFVQGKTSGDDFVRYGIERYGIKVLVVSIPKQMASYFGASNPKIGDKAPQELQNFMVRDNIDRISSMCGFQK